MRNAPTARNQLWTLLQPWIQIQELPKHLANTFPFLLGNALAFWERGTIRWSVFWLSLLGLYLLTNGTYVANEYFDYENDKINYTRIGGRDRVGVTTTGGTRVLVLGLVPRHQALVFAIACFVLAIPVGLVLRYRLETGPLTVPLGLLALFVGWFYSAPPIAACYRGLGELFIALGQGLVVFGAYYVQAGSALLPLAVSVPWFLALPALKILRQFPDYDADSQSGKRGLVVLLGREKMAKVYGLLAWLAVASLLAIPFLTTPWTALALVPAWLLGESAWTVSRGEWRVPERLERAAVRGFWGMLSIPLTLAAGFLAAALWQF
ncbi:MAG TPA: prenyltransferase [Gemmatimonadaceae bacterium]|nr:prenyltransferase [Gemmatimonadaceae bacterium]